MTINKRKKNSRQRGSWTHGWGEKKKHRGAGSRGGRGKGGSGKRGDSKKPSFWKDPKYFGKYGFTSIKKNREIGMNIRSLEKQAETLVKEKMIKIEKDTYVANSSEIGFSKLIGGKAKLKWKITVPSATQKAVEAVKSAGGEVIVTNVSG